MVVKKRSFLQQGKMVEQDTRLYELVVAKNWGAT
jgi:hypothetical protein